MSNHRVNFVLARLYMTKIVCVLFSVISCSFFFALTLFSPLLVSPPPALSSSLFGIHHHAGGRLSSWQLCQCKLLQSVWSGLSPGRAAPAGLTVAYSEKPRIINLWVHVPNQRVKRSNTVAKAPQLDWSKMAWRLYIKHFYCFELKALSCRILENTLIENCKHCGILQPTYIFPTCLVCLFCHHSTHNSLYAPPPSKKKQQKINK